MTEQGVVVISACVGETRALGVKIGRGLKEGSVIALRGELGAGKTCMVQGIAAGLGVDPSACVSSPTFVIINEYGGSPALFHFDLYRVRDWREVYDLGWEDYLDKRGVIAIEWAEKMGPLLPRDHISVELEVTGKNTRRITLRGENIIRRIKGLPAGKQIKR